jgi:hypothetical protein
MDIVSDEAFAEHPTDYQENGIGESNVNSVEQVTEEVSLFHYSYYCS